MQEQKTSIDALHLVDLENVFLKANLPPQTLECTHEKRILAFNITYMCILFAASIFLLVNSFKITNYFIPHYFYSIGSFLFLIFSIFYLKKNYENFSCKRFSKIFDYFLLSFSSLTILNYFILVVKFYIYLFSVEALKNTFYNIFITRLTLISVYFTLILLIIGYYLYSRKGDTYHLVVSSRLRWFIELSNSEKIIVILFFYFGIIFVVESCISIFILKSTVFSLVISVILSIFTLAFNTWVFLDFLMIQNKKLFKKLFLFGIISFCLIILIQNHLSNLIIHENAISLLDSIPFETLKLLPDFIKFYQ